MGQLSKTLIKMGGEQKQCANNYVDWRLHLFSESNLHFWYPQSISLLNQYQDIISYQMQFECITFHSGKFLQMCKCVIQPMKRIKNQFSTEFFQILLYTGSFWNYAIGYWILAQFCAIFWSIFPVPLAVDIIFLLLCLVWVVVPCPVKVKVKYDGILMRTRSDQVTAKYQLHLLLQSSTIVKY